MTVCSLRLIAKVKGDVMKRFDVYGLGNGLVDVFLEANDAQFDELGFEKGTMRLVDVEEQQELLDRFGAKDLILASGGSVANSIIAVSQLGGAAAFACALGDDRYGVHFKSEFDDLGIEVGNPLLLNQTTGTCFSIVTPDAERTMRTCLGVASHLSEKQIDEDTLTASTWLFIEGYLFSNPDTALAAIEKALHCADKSECKVAITFSEAWVIETFGDQLRKAVEKADLVFANEAEAKAFTGLEDFDKACVELGRAVPSYVVTRGGSGARVSYSGCEGHVDAFPCSPVDLTGAGDMFAGAFLYGITNGFDPLETARRANYLASKVISHTGARLHSGVLEGWKDCPAG